MSEFTGFCVGGKGGFMSKKLMVSELFGCERTGPQIRKKRPQKVYPSVYEVMSFLKIGRAICHGHFLISKSVLKVKYTK